MASYTAPYSASQSTLSLKHKIDSPPDYRPDIQLFPHQHSTGKTQRRNYTVY